jgi:DNA-binding XRE family transcriptional regulator
MRRQTSAASRIGRSRRPDVPIGGSLTTPATRRRLDKVSNCGLILSSLWYHSPEEDMPPLSLLRQIRESRFLSQRDLAGLSGVSRATIHRLERGGVEARFVTVRKLAKALGVHPAELVGERGESQP